MATITSMPLTCAHCDELIENHDDRAPARHPLHIECATRMVIGGVNHLLRQCTCCGGTLPPDPPHMSKRNAAILAVAILNAPIKKQEP